MSYYVYLLSNRPHGSIYAGMTHDLIQRVYQHREGLVKSSFSYRYNVHRLVYYEEHGTFEKAKLRENTIKGWKRQWKIDLIEGMNPQWFDLWGRIVV